MAFGRLACWTAESSSMYYQICHLPDSPWGLWLQDKNPTCDPTGLTTGNYKVLPGRSPGESCPPYTRLGAQPVHLEGVAVKDSGPFWASHTHMHICIPSLGTSIWRPLYGRGRVGEAFVETLFKHLHQDLGQGSFFHFSFWPVILIDHLNTWQLGPHLFGFPIF